MVTTYSGEGNREPGGKWWQPTTGFMTDTISGPNLYLFIILLFYYFIYYFEADCTQSTVQ